MDTDDEGFFEKAGYIGAFDNFIRDFRDHQDVIFVSECLTGCGNLHELTDDDNDNIVCDAVPVHAEEDNAEEDLQEEEEEEEEETMNVD